MPRVMGPEDVERVIRRIAHEIIERNRGVASVVLVGILTRGVALARRIADVIAELEAAPVPVGILDTTPFRDDLDRRPAPAPARTDIPVDITDRTIVLVDDVLHTGRTVRAALDALVDLGRPVSVQLVAMVDRGHRQLPIRADYVGKNLPTSNEELVRVRLHEVDEAEGIWIDATA